MNTRLQNMIDQVGTDVSGKWISVTKLEHLAQLIVQDCVYAFGQTRQEPSLEKFVMQRLGANHDSAT
jgi:hypothetical protein